MTTEEVLLNFQGEVLTDQVIKEIMTTIVSQKTNSEYITMGVSGIKEN